MPAAMIYSLGRSTGDSHAWYLLQVALSSLHPLQLTTV